METFLPFNTLKHDYGFLKVESEAANCRTASFAGEARQRGGCYFEQAFLESRTRKQLDRGFEDLCVRSQKGILTSTPPPFLLSQGGENTLLNHDAVEVGGIGPIVVELDGVAPSVERYGQRRADRCTQTAAG